MKKPLRDVSRMAALVQDAPFTDVVEAPVNEDAVVEGLPLIAVWEVWLLREWDMCNPLVRPPMPPLEEWPKGARETFDRLMVRWLAGKQRRLSRHGSPPEGEETQ